MNASRVLINIDVPQVNYFRRLLDSESMEIDKTHIAGDEEFYNNTLTLKEINGMLQDSTKEGTTWSCEAKITGLVEDKPWYYDACTRCHKKVVSKGTQFVCPECPRALYEGHIPWYSLQLRIRDKTDRPTLTIILKG